MPRTASTLLLTLTLLASGCASFGRGLGEALVANATKDTRQCAVRGHPFEGMESFLRLHEQGSESATPHHVLKVLMVHGIGTHSPGYGTGLAERLAMHMGLSITKRRFRQFDLRGLKTGERELGSLRVSRYFSEGHARDMFFYELTWAPIVQPAKQSLAYDSSGEQSFRRASINDTAKKFLNDTAPDVTLYRGSAHEAIQASVGQALCWMVTRRWQELPNGGRHTCDPRYAAMPLLDLDELVFVSHSLGSRIMLDSLETLMASVQDPKSPVRPEVRASFRRKRFSFFMLSNQLPLLQLGLPEPPVHDQIPAYCTPQGAHFRERWMRELTIVAMSDPNDLLSYTLPADFVDHAIDSRLCPTVVNVTLNISRVTDLLGVGQIADPYGAHTGYDADPRVIGLMVGGIGGATTDPEVADRCTWMEER